MRASAIYKQFGLVGDRLQVLALPHGRKHVNYHSFAKNGSHLIVQDRRSATWTTSGTRDSRHLPAAC
jgi:hypothetical protein